jgi:HAMP domain-containing protein
MKNQFTEKHRSAMSIQTKIILWVGIGFLLSSAFIIGYAAFALRSEAIRSAEVQALDVAHAQAAEIQTVLERTLSAGETFTESVIVVKTEGVQLGREQVNAMLRQVLKDNPQFVGVDVLFEPNAFDGRDAEFINTEGSDANGRFLPYWTRGEGGKIQVELLQDYDVSDWYQCPKLTKVPCLIDPYVYPVQGQDVWMTSLVIPFVHEDTFLGITGIDTPVTFLQELADQVDIFNGEGKLVIISNNGTLLGVTGQPDLIGQPVTALHDHFTAEDYQAIREGKELLRYGSEESGQLDVFVPVQVGETANPWSVNVIVPSAAILADASSQMWRMIAIGIGLLVVSLVALFYAARQIAQPIRKITDVALQVAGGNLDVVADVQSADETGILANAFNQMTEQLRTLFGTLEQRVADRTKDLATVAEISTATATIRDPKEMLANMVRLTQRGFGLYHVHVFTFHKDTTELQIVACGWKKGDPNEGLLHGDSPNISLFQEQSLVARAARTKQPVIINDVRSEPDWLPNPQLPETRAEMVVPMIVGDELLGVLDVQSEHLNAFSDEDANIQMTLASQIATALQNAITYDRTQKQAELESLVNVIGQKIQRTTSIEETLQTAIRELGSAIGASRVKARLQPASDGRAAEAILPPEPVVGEVESGEQPL